MDLLTALYSRNFRIILTAASLIELKGSLLKSVSATWLISFGIDPYLSSDRQKELIAPTRMLATWVLVSLEDDVALQSTPVCSSGIERARAVLALTTQSQVEWSTSTSEPIDLERFRVACSQSPVAA